MLGRRLAVGGMGEIFEATDGRTDAVLKLLLPQHAKNAEIVGALAHEGELARRLAHPNVVRVLEVHASGAEPHLVLERVDGAPLSDLLEAPLPLPEALAAVLPLLDALEHVHGARGEDGAALGIVHRDVTPQNVLVSRDGVVKLTDFGIARSRLKDARTRTGIVKGKLNYLAPEQVTGSSVDARTDLYAIGLVLFELSTGQSYLQGEDDVALLRVAEDPPPRAPSEVAGVDRRLDPLLARALARFPEERWPSAAAFRRALSELVEAPELERARAALAERVAACAPAPVAPARPRVPGTTILIAVSLPAALLVAAGWWWSAQAPSAPPAAVLEGTRVASPPAPPAPRAPELRELAAPEPSEPAAPTPPSPEPAASEPALTAPGSRGPQSNVYMADVPPRARRTRPPEAPLVAVGEPPPDLAPSIEALRAGLRERGILTSDLSAEQRRALDALAASGDPRSVEALERELAGVRVDEAFVRRKLGRIDERMRSARARGLDTRSLEPSSALALQELFEGRHEDVNRRLNELSRRLDALERNASHK